MADTEQAETIDPATQPDPMKAEPGAPTEVSDSSSSPADADPNPAPEHEPADDALARFRMHWRGGEHRLALDLVKAGEFVEDEFAVLVGEFPEIIDILNQ
jgi:hypothetical protein